MFKHVFAYFQESRAKCWRISLTQLWHSFVTVALCNSFAHVCTSLFRLDSVAKCLAASKGLLMWCLCFVASSFWERFCSAFVFSSSSWTSESRHPTFIFHSQAPSVDGPKSGVSRLGPGCGCFQTCLLRQMSWAERPEKSRRKPPNREDHKSKYFVCELAWCRKTEKSDDFF